MHCPTLEKTGFILYCTKNLRQFSEELDGIFLQ
jgi:hypothetical protein